MYMYVVCNTWTTAALSAQCDTCIHAVCVRYIYMYSYKYISLFCSSDNPEVTVGGHAPLRAESSGQRSSSPNPEVRKRNSTAPLLEPTATQGAELTDISMIVHVLV